MSTNILKSKDITSYDLLKALAVLIMVVDHIGFHFYPEEVWFRIVGRLCVPIWFFLIGYARTTEITKGFWIGGIIVVASALVAGQFLLPLNILFMMALARYMRGGLVERTLYNAETLRGMYLILVFASIPTGIIFEYGSLGLLFVLMGYIVRNWEEVSARIMPRYLVFYIVASFLAFWILQGAIMPRVNAAHMTFLMIGLVCVGNILFWFKPLTYPRLTKILTPPGAFIMRVLGRKTLEFYVLHLVLFRLAAMYLDPARFSFLEWKIIPGNILSPLL